MKPNEESPERIKRGRRGSWISLAFCLSLVRLPSNSAIVKVFDNFSFSLTDSTPQTTSRIVHFFFDSSSTTIFYPK